MVAHPSNRFVEFPGEEITRSLTSRFALQAFQFPDRIAVHDGTKEITYAELDRLSNRIANSVLARWGAGAEPVALLFDPSVLMVAAILGVLKSGRFFLPLDPMSPAARNAAILESSHTAHLLTDAGNSAAAAGLARRPTDVMNVEALDDTELESPPGERATPETLACVLYTSGSTGEPKGVLHNHRNLLHSIREHTNSMRINFEDRISFLAFYGHIAGVTSIFRALLNGACLCIFNLRANGWGELPRWLAAREITIYQSVPTLFRQWSRALTDAQQFPKLRVVHLGGERVTTRDVALYRKLTAADCILVHNLGSTEAPTFRQNFINKETVFIEDMVPVGYPVEDKEVVLIDESGKEVAPYEVGEIVIKSRFLAVGYWQNPSLSANTFLPDPMGGDARVFRTGDLGRMRPDGCLEHLGRKDRQVKIRGVRIEPAEIEAVLEKHPSVRQAVVIARDDSAGERQLVAYLIPASQSNPGEATVREFLRGLLPAHMVPTAYVTLAEFPLTATGKVDHLALPNPVRHVRQSDVPYVAARTPIEAAIVRIWEEVLEVPGIGVEDRFLDLGGNSLKAMQVITRLQDALRGVLPLQSLFTIATIAEQAAAVEKHLLAAKESEESRALAELEAMSDEEAERLLATGAGETDRNTSQWQTEGVSKSYLEVRTALPGADLQVEVMLKLIREWFPAPKTALDLGCGDGFLGRALMQHFPGCHVTFVDFSDPMLDAARVKIGQSDRATIRKADFSRSNWLQQLGSSAFDLVVSGLSIHHQRDVRKYQLYGEIHARLSKGGIFLNLEQVSSATDAVATVYHEFLIDHLHAFARKTMPDKARDEIAAGFYSSPARKENLLAPVEVQCGWLRKIGFRDVDCFFKVLEHALFGGRKGPGTLEARQESPMDGRAESAF